MKARSSDMYEAVKGIQSVIGILLQRTPSSYQSVLNQPTQPGHPCMIAAGRATHGLYERRNGDSVYHITRTAGTLA